MPAESLEVRIVRLEESARHHDDDLKAVQLQIAELRKDITKFLWWLVAASAGASVAGNGLVQFLIGG